MPAHSHAYNSFHYATLSKPLLALVYLASPMIEIRVGEGDDVRPFHIHKDLLTSRSKFFATALKGYKASSESDTHDTLEIIHWKEGNEGVVELPKDEPEVFETYIQLLYQGVIPIRKKPAISVPVEESADPELEAKIKKEVRELAGSEYRLLADLYVLAEKIQDIAAKRSILSAFVEATSTVRADDCKHYAAVLHITRIYAGTLPSDPMRAFLVDCYVFIGHIAWAENDTAASYPQEFMYDIMVGMFKERTAPENATRIKDATSYLTKLQPYVEKKGA